ncbi:hypothetical protein OG252_24850 [Streptomyces sp. NBC_01352]|uniref:Uncharacterized protein n=1 Tax=Streptomyces plumbiresistens TaxID=511811 RepID=A0ABP7RTA6_9ACTN|nr:MULTISPECIES: hypothetical protein [unclassified Streptomyces]MCX4699242.1 hypothetical protein [Streptomyces sp. NBC_01373]
MPHTTTAAAGTDRIGRPAAATSGPTRSPGTAGLVMPLWQALAHPLSTDLTKGGLRP